MESRGIKDFNRDLDIYDMCMLETVIYHGPDKTVRLMRVPGGWFIAFDSAFINGPNHSGFIPYSEEFRKDPEEILKFGEDDQESEIHNSPDVAPEKPGEN